MAAGEAAVTPQIVLSRAVVPADTEGEVLIVAAAEVSEAGLHLLLDLGLPLLLAVLPELLLGEDVLDVDVLLVNQHGDDAADVAAVGHLPHH